MKKIIKSLKQLFCKHIFKNVENSKYYFHEKCAKCGFEIGMGNFKYKN